MLYLATTITASRVTINTENKMTNTHKCEDCGSEQEGYDDDDGSFVIPPCSKCKSQIITTKDTVNNGEKSNEESSKEK